MCAAKGKTREPATDRLFRVCELIVKLTRGQCGQWQGLDNGSVDMRGLLYKEFQLNISHHAHSHHAHSHHAQSCQEDVSQVWVRMRISVMADPGRASMCTFELTIFFNWPV